jgi:hypothetical protein
LQSKISTNTVAVNSSLGKYTAETTKPGITALGFYFTSIIDAGTTFFSMAFGLFFASINIAQVSLGVPPIITAGIEIILTVLVILGVWSMLRAGR